jgi:hypothetical protein
MKTAYFTDQSRRLVRATSFSGRIMKAGSLNDYTGLITTQLGGRDGAVVKVLRYKSEGRWFDSRWCHWKFSVTQSFRSHYGPGVDSASNRNESQEHFLGGQCVRLTTLPPSCAVVMKSWNLNFLEPSGSL